MSNIYTDLNNLREKDLYSIILYAIYKCTGDTQYSTIAELIYTIDKDNLFNLCSIFGGCTIKIPTVIELKMYIGALLIYDLISKGKSFSDAYKETGLDSKYKKEVASIYTTIKDIIDEYRTKA